MSVGNDKQRFLVRYWEFQAIFITPLVEENHSTTINAAPAKLVNLFVYKNSRSINKFETVPCDMSLKIVDFSWIVCNNETWT